MRSICKYDQPVLYNCKYLEITTITEIPRLLVIVYILRQLWTYTDHHILTFTTNFKSVIRIISSKSQSLQSGLLNMISVSL